MNDGSSRNRVVAIIQARMGSTRLPGKVLADIGGHPMLQHVIERVARARTVDRVVVATSDNPADDAVAAFCETQGIACFRGSENDVLDRFYQAALQFHAANIVRVTADDPFKDPEVIDLIVTHLLEDPSLDYVSNTIEPSYPEGLDVEAFAFSALERAWKEATLPSDREHVTPFIWRQPGLFKLKNIRHEKDLSSLRWTLDYKQDLQFTREIYARLYHGQVFTMREILALLDTEPQLVEINRKFERNAGYKESLCQDSSLG